MLNAAKWVDEEYGTSTLQEVVRACSPAVRERYVSAIAINWHPLEELVEFLGAADRIIGHGDGRIAEHIGAAGARANMRGVVVRFAFYVAKPEFLVQRLANLWRQFNDEGTMRFTEVSEAALKVEVLDLSTPNWLFCCTITGWAREVMRAVGVANPTARHVECRARGQARCIWEVRGARPAGPPDSSGTLPAASAIRTPKR